MSGVNRPYTFADIIGSVAAQSDQGSGVSSSSAGTGFIAEDDETAGLTESVTAAATAVTPEWGSATWGNLAWQ